MNCCIFCKSRAGPFTTREHILPESLGGNDSLILPPGLFCDSCQNRFGSEIEQQALGDYPFNMLRVFLCLPTKKGKSPWLTSWNGRIGSGSAPGRFCFDSESPFAVAVDNGTKTEIRLLAHPTKPQMICRTLLKMGLEVIASDNPDDAFAAKFDAARDFALCGRKSGEWWYLQHEDHALWSKLLRGEPTQDFEPLRLEVWDIGENAKVFYLRLYFLDMIVPMENSIIPDFAEFTEPENRLFTV